MGRFGIIAFQVAWVCWFVQGLIILSICFGSLLLGLYVYIFGCELIVSNPMPFNNCNFLLCAHIEGNVRFKHGGVKLVVIFSLHLSKRKKNLKEKKKQLCRKEKKEEKKENRRGEKKLSVWHGIFT